MTNPDILTKLRESDGGYFMRQMFTEAADEIERLRAELVSTTNRLTAERDEARRMYCEGVILHGTAHRFDANGVPEEITEAEELARMLKWDCFKENTNDR